MNPMEWAVLWTARQIQKRVPWADDNPWLRDAFAPVHEEITETTLEVAGTLPRELNGRYLRIGPNPIHVDNPATYHWFTGEGMVHGVRLRDGHACWYRNRWVASEQVCAHKGIAAPPGERHGVSDIVNTNVIRHAGRLWALVEAGAPPVELDDELETLRYGGFTGAQSAGFAPHPHLDPATGELHAICYDALDARHLRHVVVDAGGRVTLDTPIPVRHGPMVHDCALTRKYVVVFDLPVTFSVMTLLRGGSLPYRWNRRHPARVGLLPRQGDTTDIRWFTVDPCYVFHAVNARDLPDAAVELEAVVHPVMFDQRRPTGPEHEASRLERWHLRPDTDHVHRQALSELREEFPRCDERRTTGSYRYAYSVGFGAEAGQPQPLYRHDLETGRVLRHDYGPHAITAEAVFVPHAADSDEDDGWLLSYVYDADRDRSALVVLNAGDIDGEPQAVVRLPQRVPLGFHGNWIVDTDPAAAAVARSAARQ